MPIKKLALDLANRTADAYSCDRYGKYWRQCAQIMLEAGLSESETEAILRSKHMRWAADMSDSDSARANFAAFSTYFMRHLPAIRRNATDWQQFNPRL